MQVFVKLNLATALLMVSTLSIADIANGPNPYAPGFGFDTPQEASWGLWTRGSAGSLYAEWDTFVDASYGASNDRTAAPGVGSSGTSDAWLGWNQGTFVAGSGNLYSFTVPELFAAEVTGSTTGNVRVALQIETWGMPLDATAVDVNGQGPTYHTLTYTDPAHPSSLGPVTLDQHLFYWDLAAAPSYAFQFSGGPHLSLAQVAIDVGVPVPLPPAFGLMGAALASLGIIGRRRAQG